MSRRAQLETLSYFTYHLSSYVLSDLYQAARCNFLKDSSPLVVSFSARTIQFLRSFPRGLRT